jgi:putative peptide zinc metalloprotease protein
VVAPPLIAPADRPVRADGVTLHRRADDGAVLLERRGRYVQLSPAAAAIWEWCDGCTDVATIARRYRERYAVDGAQATAALLDGWCATGFVARDARVATGTSERSECEIERRGASIYVWWPLDRWAATLRVLARVATAPALLVAVAAVALWGGIVALHLGTRMALHGVAQFVAFGLLLALALVVHEAGHAVALVRFGGNVRRAGVGWYWCSPIAFVDTSDAHALPRAQRLAVSLAGPFASFCVAALATLAAATASDESVRAVASALAFINYGASWWNLNPLIELDGYYVLTDLLGRPNLRRDAFRALRRRTADRVELAYAVGAIGYALVFAVSMVRAILIR